MSFTVCDRPGAIVKVCGSAVTVMPASPDVVSE
ncbi:MAG: hypothetical protein BWY91_02852 [bacterium ADurb.BinA028]|nr:MAG: hypothetical protein BWY91_02852 [bacterium ADurb.BinA028]